MILVRPLDDGCARWHRRATVGQQVPDAIDHVREIQLGCASRTSSMKVSTTSLVMPAHRGARRPQSFVTP